LLEFLLKFILYFSLAHPNLHAFITHCGQNSITESAIAGIPIIGIPLFADQFYNADIAQKRGLGIQIDVNDLSGPNAENILVEAIRSVRGFLLAEFKELQIPDSLPTKIPTKRQNNIQKIKINSIQPNRKTCKMG